MSVQDREQFETQLRSETIKINRSFDNVATATKISFQRMQVSLEDICMNVKNLQPSIELMSERSFSLLKWKTMGECFSHLASYWSWFNTFILEQLIDHYGKEEDKKRMALYLERRSSFLKRGIFYIPQDAYGNKREENSKRLVLKLASSVYNSSEATCLKQLQIFVYETLQKHAELLEVKKGCLEMTFQIPDQDVPHLSQEQKSALSQKGVISLTIEGEVYFQVDIHVLEYVLPRA